MAYFKLKQIFRAFKPAHLVLVVAFTLCFMLSSYAWAQYAPSGRIPKITIGGQQVLTNEQLKHQTLDSDLPAALHNDRSRMAIENRRRIQVWNHTPVRGPEKAPVTLLEINDLSCLYCQELSKKVDEIFEKEEFKGKVQHLVMYLPVDHYNYTNSAAFYGRLAFDAGYFWQYRKSLYDASAATDNVFIDKLLNIGVAEKDIRKMTRKNARRYYRELDADLKSAKSLGEMRPPALYVNGIKIGGSITMEELEPLLQYEIKLYERKQ